MADIRVNITGDSSGARTEMSLMGEAVKKLDDSLGVSTASLAKGAAAAAAAVAAVAAVSLRAYMDSERVQRQLTRAFGEGSAAIDEQSRALSKLYAVDDDLINQSATLLGQWGGQAAASKDAEIAALNLASAMGVDLNTATELLIRNVESGGTGLAKMGIHFKATGDKGRDLEAAVAAINKKLGGAAAADSASLTGRLHAANLAFEDIQKSIGGSVAKFLEQTGVVQKLTAAMRDLNDMFTPTADKQAEDPAFVAQQVQFWEGIASGNIEGWKDAEAGIKFTFEEAQAEIAKWRAKLNPGDFNAAFEGKGRVTGSTNAGGKTDAREAAAAAKAAAKEAADVRRGMAEEDARDQKDFQRKEIDAQDEYAKESIRIEKERLAEIQKSQEEVNKWLAAIDKEEAAAALKTQKEEAKLEEQALADQNERLEKKVKQAQAAGDAIGAAMVNALADQLSKLAEGGEFDAALFISEILAAAVGVAGTVIGTAFGQPAVGAAIGNLAAMGIRAGGSAISKGNKRNGQRTYHDGGWVGDEPRHHSGAWIGSDEQRAILQTGERVLSRAEVHHMGGPQGVDRAAKGGPALNVTIHAIDSKSAADSFASDLGRGLRQAIRSGRGDVPSILGMSPR